MFTIELGSEFGKPASEVVTPRYLRKHEDGQLSWTEDEALAKRFPTRIGAAQYAERRLSASVRIREL